MDRLPKKDRAIVKEKLEEDGLLLLTDKIASKIWTTMTWAVCEGDVSIMRVLRSTLGWRTTAWWRSRASWHGVGSQ